MHTVAETVVLEGAIAVVVEHSSVNAQVVRCPVLAT